jgi:hypothetical protein
MFIYLFIYEFPLTFIQQQSLIHAVFRTIIMPVPREIALDIFAIIIMAHHSRRTSTHSQFGPSGFSSPQSWIDLADGNMMRPCQMVCAEKDSGPDANGAGVAALEQTISS